MRRALRSPGVVEPKRNDQLRLQSLHSRRIAVLDMVVSPKMKYAVYHQVRKVCVEGLVLRQRLAGDDRRTDRDVPVDAGVTVLGIVGERQYLSLIHI